MKRNRQIDGLRCIALVMIIAFHYFYRYNQIYNAGNGEIQIFKYFGVFGVNIFLLISAYFMYIPLKTNVDVDLKNYYKKKLLRLWPVYLCSIVMICIVLYIIPLPGRMVSGKDFIYNVFMINGYIGTPYVDGAHWYLTTLVAFYFIQGILLKTRKLENIYCLAIWLLLDILCNILNVPVFKVVMGNTYAGAAVIGILAGKTVYNRSKLSKAEWIICCIAFAERLHFGGIVSCMTLLVAAGLVWCCIAGKFPFLEKKAFILGAEISYCLYLIHQNISYSIMYNLEKYHGSSIINVMVAFGVVLLMAVLLHKFIEKPVQAKLKNIKYIVSVR